MASTNFEDLILRDAATSRPAAGVPGRLFYDTTNNKLQRDNGSTWDDVAETASAGIARSGSTTDEHLAVWNGSDADSLKDGGVPSAGGGNATESVNAGSETLTTEGDLNFTADGPTIQRYDGAAWQPWGPIFKLTPPPLTGWTWVNQGGASLSTAGGILTLTAPADTASFTRALVRAAPATPYTITALVGLYLPKANWYGGGLLWRQSSDGKLIFYGYQNDAAPLFSSFKVAGSANTVAGVYTPVWNNEYEPFIQSVSPFVWLRIQDEGATGGSNRICSFSYDGRYWVTHHSVGRTDYATGDQVGFGLLHEANNFPTGMTVFSWAVT